MCSKRKFPDEFSANFRRDKIRSARGRHLKGKFETHAYRCTMGGTVHWHLTSQQPNEQRRTN